MVLGDLMRINENDHYEINVKMSVVRKPKK